MQTHGHREVLMKSCPIDSLQSFRQSQSGLGRGDLEFPKAPVDGQAYPKVCVLASAGEISRHRAYHRRAGMSLADGYGYGYVVQSR